MQTGRKSRGSVSTIILYYGIHITHYHLDETLYAKLEYAEIALDDAEGMVELLSEDHKEYVGEWSSMSTEPQLVNGVWTSVYRETTSLRKYNITLCRTGIE